MVVRCFALDDIEQSHTPLSFTGATTSAEPHIRCCCCMSPPSLRHARLAVCSLFLFILLASPIAGQYWPSQPPLTSYRPPPCDASFSCLSSYVPPVCLSGSSRLCVWSVDSRVVGSVADSEASLTGHGRSDRHANRPSYGHTERPNTNTE